MRTRTRPLDEPDVMEEGGIIEVETVRTRQHVAAAVDAAAPDAVLSERSVGYFETLPERLGAVGLVARTTIEALLGIRFLLHAFGANTGSAFVGFVDDVSWPLAGPFANAFTNPSWGPGNIEVTTLVAMGVYLLVFKLLGMLVSALTPRLSGDAPPRGVTALWSSTAASATTPPPPAEDGERPRRPHHVTKTRDTRKPRRLLRRMRARES